MTSISVHVVRADVGEAIDVAGVSHLFKLVGKVTGDQLGFERFVVEPGVLGARPHVHRRHDELFFVLVGELTVATENGEVMLGAGDLAYAPRGSVHGYRNATAVATTALCVYTPPGYEGFFRDVHAAVAAGHELSDERLRGLRSHYDTDTV